MQVSKDIMLTDVGKNIVLLKRNNSLSEILELIDQKRKIPTLHYIPTEDIDEKKLDEMFDEIK